jgi:hypothetical protein
MKRLQKLTNKCPLKTFFIGSLTAATVLHLFEKRYKYLYEYCHSSEKASAAQFILTPLLEVRSDRVLVFELESDR